MNLSELPKLRDYRNALAKGHGGGTGVALSAANIAAKRVYDKAISGTGKPRSQLSGRAIREAVATTVAGVRRGTVTVTGRGRRAVAEAVPKPVKKGAKRKAREARIREAVRQAISREIAAAASPPRTPAATPSVRLTEMTDDQLAAAITEASRPAASTAQVTESAAAPDTDEPAGTLHEMDWESRPARRRRAGRAVWDRTGVAVLGWSRCRAGVSVPPGAVMSADLTHMGHRVLAGHGHPDEDDRRNAADVTEQRLQLAAQVLVRCLAAGDEGAARRHLQALRLDPDSGVDSWALALAATARALPTRAGESP